MTISSNLDDSDLDVTIVREGNNKITIGSSVQVVVSPLDGKPVGSDVISVSSPRSARKSGMKPPVSPNPPTRSPIKAHNRFHTGCCDSKKIKNNSSEDVREKSAISVQRMKTKSKTNLLTRQASKNEISNNLPRPDLSPEQVAEFLGKHPDMLEKYIVDHADLELLEKWTQAKKGNKPKKANAKKQTTSGLSKWKFCVSADKRAMLEVMTSHLTGSSNKAGIMWELALCISRALNADMVNLYLVQEEGSIVQFQGEDNKECVSSPQSIGSGTTIAAHCAKTKDVLQVSTIVKDQRFPEGVKGLKTAAKVLAHPICSESEDLEAVLELVRKKGPDFNDEDVEVINSYLVWGGVAIHYADLYCRVQHQKSVNEFLLTVVKSIFQEMISMDTLIVQIMNQAQKLVDADRASLFLVDAKTNQLYARIFDVSGDLLPNGEVPQAEKEIRFPIGKGVAGYVAQTGKTLNVADAYKDDRFNPGIDEQTGYTTKSILCMPICIRGAVIGVVQMINKKNGLAEFTREDEESFETIAVYCGLALHHAKLYDKIRRSEQKYKVALEVLSYHNASSVDEVEEVLKEGVPEKEEHVDVSSFTYYALGLDDMTKVRKSLFMFVDLFGLERFDYETLVRFTITVKKNYRSVAYHNWAHGFHVANSIYSILKASPGIFRPLECLAMYVGAICHDLDHRGFNNKFMIDVGSPLAAIYSTSTMEHHHFNMAINILQQEHHNIFGRLNPEEYRQVLGNMKHCILATDLALFFPNKARLTNICKENQFSWETPDHRLLVEAMMMTGSDLCASAKPWYLQLDTVAVIYEEFYRQGDVEKSLGWQPIPLFDRDHYPELASMQVGFLGGICMPCYELLTMVLPSISPMKEQCADNLATWKQLANERKELKEKEEGAKE